MGVHTNLKIERGNISVGGLPRKLFVKRYSINNHSTSTIIYICTQYTWDPTLSVYMYTYVSMFTNRILVQNIADVYIDTVAFLHHFVWWLDRGIRYFKYIPSSSCLYLLPRKAWHAYNLTQTYYKIKLCQIPEKSSASYNIMLDMYIITY